MKSGIGPVPGQKIGAVGIPWYSEADYPAVLRIMTDAHLLPATHGKWLERAQQIERNLMGEGHKVIRAVIDPKTFTMWCHLRGLANIDAKARNMWAAEEAARQIGL